MSELKNKLTPEQTYKIKMEAACIGSRDDFSDFFDWLNDNTAEDEYSYCPFCGGPLPSRHKSWCTQSEYSNKEQADG